MTRARRRATPAFTLLEVLLATGLLVVLGAGLLGLIWQVGTRTAAIDREAARLEAVRTLMDRLDAGLMTAIASGPGGEGGVRASATELSILSRGTSVDTAGASAAAAPSDLQRTRVRFDPASGTITLATTDAVLAVPSTLPEPLVHGVARFVARCADGARWRDEFDSAERGRLPAAVLVAVWFNASDDATPPDAMRLIAVPDAQTPAAPGRE